MNRYICIHGHFYQPPRENPWLDTIEIQDSAYPYPDWNQRIDYECYVANAYSRIMDTQNQIVKIMNNYTKFSFDFGPTLLTWVEENAPDTYQKILEADQESQKNFSGHGSAMAQAYNHMIMPLANDRDKETQIIWGIQDFEWRFRRKPEGMWLPETAVDLKTLELLVKYGIKFTILSPYQAAEIKKIGEEEWVDVQGGKIDSQQPFLCPLPSGKEIAIFFYDGQISNDVAFGGLLYNGENLAKRLLSVFPGDMEESRLVHIATDGETYGHHYQFGNMALSYCVEFLEKDQLAKFTNYAEYLESFPPTQEVKIMENTAWSCSHGVKRWAQDCGCHIGHSGWNQKWRAPLKEAMDWLRDELGPLYEKHLAQYVKDPWQLRNDYIQILLDRSTANIERFFSEHIPSKVTPDERVKILKLLELQKNTMFSYTSCGWFFDDIGGIEAKQILQYAARAIQLANEVTAADLEPGFLKILQSAKSNDPKLKDGKKIYEQSIKQSATNLQDMVAQYAMCALFWDYEDSTEFYSYAIGRVNYQEQKEEKRKLILGKVHIKSQMTWEEKDFDFVALELEEFNFYGFARESNARSYERIKKELPKLFSDFESTKFVKALEKEFAGGIYYFQNLFRNERTKVLNRVFQDAIEDIEALCRQIYERYLLVQEGRNLSLSLPRALSMTIEYIFQQDLIKILAQEPLDLAQLEKWSVETKRLPLLTDKEILSRAASNKLESLMEKWAQNPKDIESIQCLINYINIFNNLFIPFYLWKSQNMYFLTAQKIMAARKKETDQENNLWKKWDEYFKQLGNLLAVKIVQ